MFSRLSRAYARVSGMRLLVALLIVTCAVAADLAHEEWTTAQSQQRSAEHGARAFVRFAATGAAEESEATLALALRAVLGEIADRDRDSRQASIPGPEALARNAARIRDASPSTDCHDARA